MWYFTVSVAVLAILLFFPVSRLVWVMSVRRLERKTGTPLDASQRQGQLARARFLAVFISLLFSLLFNINLLGWPIHG